MRKVAAYCGPYLDAIQLDMIWPDPKELEAFKKDHHFEMILQVSETSMSLCADNPISVAEKISKEYQDLVSYVLLDCSLGKGVEINVPFIEGYIEAILAKNHGINIAVAGGLGPGTVKLVESLVRKYRVSVDAQSQLRISRNAKDPIDWPRANQYMYESILMY